MHHAVVNTLFFTAKGDDGIAHIGDRGYGKQDILFELLGALDELNSYLGVAQSFSAPTGKTQSLVHSLQELVFIMQSEVATIGLGYGTYETHREKTFHRVVPAHLSWMEREIVDLDTVIPQIKSFIVPGGTRAAAFLDLARAVARRVERLVVTYNAERVISPEFISIANRMSSFLFALARYENMLAKRTELTPTYRVFKD
jgi:cob(I)alamin adenosyltransferase